MTLNRLIKTICALEGKKSQVKIGDVREILKCLISIEAAAQVKEGLENQFTPGLLAMGGVAELIALEAGKKAKKEWARRKKK